ARVPAGDRAHPPDPRPHGTPAAPDRRRSAVRRSAAPAARRFGRTRRRAARVQAPGAACRNPGVRASGQRRAGQGGRAGAGRPAGTAAGPARGHGGAGGERTAMSERLRARVLHADWPAPPGVHALVTLRGGEGDATTLELPSVPAWLQQVHGTTVAVEPGSDERPEADASVTRTAGKVLAIRTADCLPVVFAARDGSEVAA